MENSPVKLSESEIEILLDVVQNKKYLEYREDYTPKVVEIRQLLKEIGVVEADINKFEDPWAESLQLTLYGQALHKMSSTDILESLKTTCNISQADNVLKSLFAGALVVGILYLISKLG